MPSQFPAICFVLPKAALTTFFMWKKEKKAVPEVDDVKPPSFANHNVSNVAAERTLMLLLISGRRDGVSHPGDLVVLMISMA